MTSAIDQQINFSTHRQQGHFISVNVGKIPGKQYYLAGQWEIPKWLTEPSLEHDWDKPDIAWLLGGMGDVYHIQEAHGFEEGGAIAKRLREHGIQTTYFQKGKAPPLAILVKGLTAADINGVAPMAYEVSGQVLNPDLAVHVEIISSDTIPWGGVKDNSENMMTKTQMSPSDQSEDEPTNGPAKDDWAPILSVKSGSDQ